MIPFRFALIRRKIEKFSIFIGKAVISMSSIHFAMVWKNIKIQGDTDSTHQLYSIQRQMITGAPSQLFYQLDREVPRYFGSIMKIFLSML